MTTDLDRTFSTDPLLMVRAARMAAAFDVALGPPVREAITRNATKIVRTEPEDIRNEMLSLMTGPRPRRGIEVLVDTGLADHVLPEIGALRMKIHPRHRHKDVYLHSLTVLDQATALESGGPDVVVRMAALLHDIGKPATRRHFPGGVSFHHHETVGARLARARLCALHMPRDVVEDVAALIRLGGRFHGYSEQDWTDAAVRRLAADAGPLLPRLLALIRADCTTANPLKAAALQRSCDALEARIARLRAKDNRARVRPELDGDAIMTLLGLDPGPLVGRAWRHLREVRSRRGPLPRDEAEAELRAWATRNLDPPVGPGPDRTTEHRDQARAHRPPR